MARLRRAPPTQNAPPNQSTRQALKDRTNTAATKVPIYDDDGNTDGLIKDARPRRGKARKTAHNEDELVMTGGLGLKDSDEVENVISEQPITTDVLAKTDGPPLSTAKATRRPSRAPRNAVQSKPQDPMLTSAKKRMQTPAGKRVAKQRHRDLVDDEIIVASSDSATAKKSTKRQSNQSRTERSEFSLSPSPPPPGKLPSVKRSSLAQPGSALRLQSTPSAETSILALKNFKRRPRQPSMLQMVQQRTASARPSFVNMNVTQDVDEFELEAGSEDEEFAPEAEGTPVLKRQAGKTQTSDSRGGAGRSEVPSSSMAPPSAQSRKRKSDGSESSLSALASLKAKRQKQSDPDAGDISAIYGKNISARPSSSERQQTPQPRLSSDIQVIHSSPSSTPPTDPPSSRARDAFLDPGSIVLSTEKQQDYTIPVNIQVEEEADEDLPNGTMADPISSSPIPSSPPPAQATRGPDIMADPLTQLSPPRPKVRDKRTAKPLNTATLQALLPKRRQPAKTRRRKSEYDLESDGDGPMETRLLDPDEDELSGRRRQTKQPTASKSKSKQRKAPLSRKSTARPSSAVHETKGRANGTSKTYGRHTTSDKENDEAEAFEDVRDEDSLLPTTGLSMHEAAQSRELEMLKRKFEDLEGWEMEFESVGVGEEGRSSSFLWR